MKINIFLTILSLIFHLNVIAGTGESLPAVIDGTLTLDAKNYQVNGNILISSTGQLNILAGAKIYFSHSAIIRVEGGLSIKGEPKKLVTCIGENPRNSGGGFVVSGSSKSSIDIQFATFESLKTPIDLQTDWHRTSVNISNCEFTKTYTNQPAILLRIPNNLGEKQGVKVSFSNNRFFDNSACILIEDFSNELSELSFTNNYIAENRGYGMAPEGIITAPVFLIANNNTQQPVNDFTQNIFMDNYLIDPDYDTIVTPLNFGSGGVADKVFVPNNFFGGEKLKEKLSYIDHFSNNSNQPLVNIEPTLNTIPVNAPAFIKTVKYNGELVKDPKNYRIKPTSEEVEEDLEITVLFTNDLDIGASKPTVEFSNYFEEDNQITTQEVENEVIWLDDRTAKIQLKAKFEKGKASFFKFLGFKDKRGYKVPPYELGSNSFKKIVAKDNPKNLMHIKARNNSKEAAPLVMPVMDDSREEILKEELKELTESVEALQKAEMQRRAFEFKEVTRNWELGVFVGQSIYFGDLTGNDVIDLDNAYMAYGLRAGYNLSPRFTIRANLFAGTLKGSDLDNFRGTEFTRDFRFESKLYEGNLQLELNINKLGHRKGDRFTPSITAGVGYFYFNPKREYNGTMYSLRDLGTNGQYVRTDIDPYNLIQLTLPFGFHLKKIVRDNWVADLFLQWNYTFTDYIDDVGGGRFATRDEIFNAPHLTELEKEAAWHFNAPNNTRSGNRGNAGIKDWYVIYGLSIARIIK